MKNNNKPKPIKPFKTLDEEASFWDTHDISPLFKNSKTKVSNLPLLEKEKDVMVTIRIQKSVKNDLEKAARIYGVNTSTLARTWLIEKLREAIKTGK